MSDCPEIQTYYLLWCSRVKESIGGCICSPLEVYSLRHKFPEPFQLITPGIRSSGVSLEDQERVLTPLEALKAGSS